uniref:Tryptophan synthase beta chain n=1 Tax=Solanum tuberosum TaxID=4113 RepID=M1CUC6_SOLTU
MRSATYIGTTEVLISFGLGFFYGRNIINVHVKSIKGSFNDSVSQDEDVRLIGVEAGGTGLDSDQHSATMARGQVGVYHGAMSYLLQDEDRQFIGPHSIV